MKRPGSGTRGRDRALLELKGHTFQLNCVAFSPDGTRIATGSDDKTAKVWGLAADRNATAAVERAHRLGVERVVQPGWIDHCHRQF